MKSVLVAALAVAFALVLAPTSQAQFRDPAQQKVDYLNFGTRGYSAQSAGRRLQQARQYTEHLHGYVQAAPAVPSVPAVTKVEAEHIGQTIQAAKQNLEVVRKDAEKTGEKAILSKLESIDKHLAAALAHHKMLNMECCKEQVDGAATAKCCAELTKELDKALHEHADLLKLIEAGAPKK